VTSKRGLTYVNIIKAQKLEKRGDSILGLQGRSRRFLEPLQPTEARPGEANLTSILICRVSRIVLMNITHYLGYPPANCPCPRLRLCSVESVRRRPPCSHPLGEHPPLSGAHSVHLDKYTILVVPLEPDQFQNYVNGGPLVLDVANPP
jgi:hypothetical protein